MSQSNPFPPEITERLQDEAHAELCRQVLAGELDAARQAARDVEATRAPFAFLASKKTREAFATSMEGARRSEQQVQERLERVERILHWAQGHIRQGLDHYLLAASADYRAFDEPAQLAGQWRRALQGLAEQMQAFARDARIVLEQAGEAVPAPLESLRIAVVGIMQAGARCNELSSRFAIAAQGRLPDGVRLPALPRLPDVAWLDKLIRTGLAAAAEELRQSAAAAREFCQTGRNQLIAQLPDSESAAAQAKAAYLEAYWQQLREHTRQYHVSNPAPEPDVVLAHLEHRLHQVEQRRHQQLLTTSPFAFVR